MNIEYNFPNNFFDFDSKFFKIQYYAEAINQLNEMCIKDPINHMDYIKDFYEQILNVINEKSYVSGILFYIYDIAGMEDCVISDDRKYLTIIRIIAIENLKRLNHKSIEEVKNNFSFNFPFDEIISSWN